MACRGRREISARCNRTVLLSRRRRRRRRCYLYIYVCTLTTITVYYTYILNLYRDTMAVMPLWRGTIYVYRIRLTYVDTERQLADETNGGYDQDDGKIMRPRAALHGRAVKSPRLDRLLLAVQTSTCT